MTADPIAIARDLIRCRSVTPEDGGALGFLQGLLAQAGFEVHRAIFTEAGTAPINLHFEDIELGARFESEAHTVTAADIAAFAEVTRDHHPLHLDPAYAISRGFPTVIAHGLFGLSLMEGLKSS